MTRAVASRLTGVEIARLGPADWAVLKSARLDALRDSPDAFVATLESEEAKSREDWVVSVTGATWVVARKGDLVVGLACMTTGADVHPIAEDDGPFIESVWVRPGYRRRGLVRKLLDELEDRARRDGAGCLQLWVLETNDTAHWAYLKMDFEEIPAKTQESDKWSPDGRRIPEIPMIKPLL